MSHRSQLPDRRPSETISFEHCNIAYVATVSRYPNGQIMELFLDGPKTGSTAEIIAKECAVITSLALQYGCPADVLYDALQKLENDEPAGPVGAALNHLGMGTHA